jgi:hypothetical protein
VHHDRQGGTARLKVEALILLCHISPQEGIKLKVACKQVPVLLVRLRKQRAISLDGHFTHFFGNALRGKE